MEKEPKGKPNFTTRLVASITALSLLGLAVMYVIANTVVRELIYNAVAIPSEVTERQVFQSLAPIMLSLATLLIALLSVTMFFASRLVKQSQALEGKGVTAIASILQKLAEPEVLGMEVAQGLQRFDVDGREGVARRFEFKPEAMPYGCVLVVDDIEANLFVAKGLLAFYGLNVETCQSGFEAIEKIKQGNVYDIIFMDSMMPDFDGTETMLAIRDMGYSNPIITLTASALIGQADEFIRSGFDDFISKPIQTTHLNSILVKYIRDKQLPEVVEAARASRNLPAVQGHIDDYQSNGDFLKELRTDFSRVHKNAFDDLTQALGSDDFKGAHILAHTLKGSAGLIKETALSEVAGRIEDSLKDEIVPDSALLSAFDRELKCVLEGIGASKTAVLPSHQTLDKAKTLALFDRLDPLLATNNADCLRLLSELRKVPETAVLIRQIESFDFKVASNTLGVLRAIFEERYSFMNH
ncbi:MAG: response regulator [Oscillospiraceae bacterium]|nr:response regulator [Oscillospiraceae bacterium]